MSLVSCRLSLSVVRTPHFVFRTDYVVCVITYWHLVPQPPFRLCSSQGRAQRSKPAEAGCLLAHSEYTHGPFLIVDGADMFAFAVLVCLTVMDGAAWLLAIEKYSCGIQSVRIEIQFFYSQV